MDFSYTPQQETLRNLVRDFAQKEIAPKAAELDRTGEFDRSLIPKLYQRGLLGVVIPKEYGGQGASHIDQAIIVEGLAYESMMVLVLNLAWAMPYELYRVGTEENRKRWLRYLFDGKKLGAHAGSEADAGTDAASLRCWAELKDDHWVINGTKFWVSNLEVADYYFLTLRTSPDRYGGISTIIVEKGTPGMTIGRRINLVSNRTISNGELILENCRVPKENLIGRLGHGFYDMLLLYDVIRCYLAAGAVGLSQRAFDEAVKFAQERKQFGKPIGDFQLVRAMIADMATEIEAARLLTYKALLLEEKGVRHTRETSMCKLYASETAERVTDKALHIHGGYGLTTDYPIERLWRDSKLLTIGEGTSELQRLIIAWDIFKSGKIVLDSALD